MTTNGTRHMSFEEIEAKRASHEIAITKLCRKAELDASTYHKVRKGDIAAARLKTLCRLQAALEQIILERTGAG